MSKKVVAGPLVSFQLVALATPIEPAAGTHKLLCSRDSGLKLQKMASPAGVHTFTRLFSLKIARLFRACIHKSLKANFLF